MNRVRITLVRGLIGSTERQRRTVATLGLRKIRDSVERQDGAELQGMLRRVSHLVKVEEVSS